MRQQLGNLRCDLIRLLGDALGIEMDVVRYPPSARFELPLSAGAV